MNTREEEIVTIKNKLIDLKKESLNKFQKKLKAYVLHFLFKKAKLYPIVVKQFGN